MNPAAMNNLKDRTQFIVDDWGMSPGINEAALCLADAGLLAGVSVLADSRFVTHGLEKLLRFEDVRIGCHLNLTFETSKRSIGSRLTSSIRSLSQLIEGGLNPMNLARRFEGQIDSLVMNTGRVDYVDGHQHVHLVPGVLGTVRKIAQRRKLPIRVISERSHLGSYLAGVWGRAVLSPSEIFVCRYLRDEDFVSSETFLRKLEGGRGASFVLHPSVRDDFETLGVADRMRSARVVQFQRVVDSLALR